MAFHLGVSIQTVVSMAYEEVLGWLSYFEARPVGWRDDDRIFKVLQTQGVKAKPDQIFTSLKPIYARDDKDKGLKSSLFFEKMMNSTGGDKLQL